MATGNYFLSIHDGRGLQRVSHAAGKSPTRTSVCNFSDRGVQNQWYRQLTFREPTFNFYGEKEVDILPLSTILIFYFRTVLTVWYSILELF
jgi:hypothetical protein